MDIRLHTGKGITLLNKALKGITMPTASKALTEDLCRSNILIRTQIFEAAMQATVVITLKIRIADSLGQVLLQIRTMLLRPPGGEGDTSRIFNGLQAMQVLTIGAAANIASNPLQGICRPLLIRNQPQVNQTTTTTIHFDLRKIYRLRTRAKKT